MNGVLLKTDELQHDKSCRSGADVPRSRFGNSVVIFILKIGQRGSTMAGQNRAFHL